MTDQREIVLPDLGDVGHKPRACVWLVKVGQEVLSGDPLLEVVVGDVVVDIPSPCAGRLATKLVGEDELLCPGQALGTVEPSKADV